MKRLIVFYVHHYGGLGHTKRVIEICRECVRLGKDIQILIIHSGERQDFLFPQNTRIKHIGLENYITDGYTCVKTEKNLQIHKRRVGMLQKIINNIHIDTLVIEHFPFGREDIAEEIITFITSLRKIQPTTQIFSSVRDIIHTIPHEQNLQLFDRILIHGDQKMVDITLPENIQNKCIYTGYVVNTYSEAENTYDIVCNIGGGTDGIEGIYQFLEILEKSEVSKEDPRILLVLGKQSELHAEKLKSRFSHLKNIDIYKYIGKLEGLKQGARILVQMGGYNNLVESAYFGIPSIIYPRITDLEQCTRLSYFMREFETIFDGRKLSGEGLESIWHMKKKACQERQEFRGATFSALFLMQYKKIEYLKLRVTNICNANCKMCGVIRRPYKTLPKNKIYTSILDFYKIGGRILNLTGGEPTLYKNYMDIFLFGKYLGMKTSLSTNGADFDEHFEKKILYNQGKSLIDYIDISIDGLGELHDTRREYTGLFQKILSGIPIIQKHHIFLHINVTLRKDNIHEAREIFDFFRHLKVDSISFGIVAPSPFNVIDDLVPDDDGIIKFYTDDYTYIKKHAGNIHLRFSPDFPQNGDISTFVQSIKSQHIFEKQTQTKCPIISSQKEIRINEDGEIAPCCTLDDFPDIIGNIYTDHFLKILCSERYFTFINKEFPHISEGCKHCKLLN